jgi:microsomal dipeptidase-like Zn-dependent dipeptidase
MVPAALPDALGGLDFPEHHVAGFDSTTRWPNVTAELLSRGYAGGDRRDFLGSNFLRFLGKVWR